MEDCHVIIFISQNRNPNFPQTLAATINPHGSHRRFRPPRFCSDASPPTSATSRAAHLHLLAQNATVSTQPRTCNTSPESALPPSLHLAPPQVLHPHAAATENARAKSESRKLRCTSIRVAPSPPLAKVRHHSINLTDQYTQQQRKRFMIHHRAFAGEEDLTGKRETAAVTTWGRRSETLILERESALCATCQHLIGQSNWSTGQLWSTGQSQQSTLVKTANMVK